MGSFLIYRFILVKDIYFWIEQDDRNASTILSRFIKKNIEYKQKLFHSIVRDFSFVSLMYDAWHYLCVTWEDIYANLTLYIDGLLVEQNEFAAGRVKIASSGNFAIGQNKMPQANDSSWMRPILGTLQMLIFGAMC